MRYVLLTSLLLILMIPSVSQAQELNAGFVQGFWYSTETIFSNEAVRMYIALRNTSGSDLTGTVQFYANGTKIGSMKINALSGRLVEAWTDWTPKAGEFIVTAELRDITLHTIGGTTETVEVVSALAEDTIVVKIDTDGDDIGDDDDTDDDNDGVSDEEERENGTDPLVFDEPIVEEEESDDTEEVLVSNLGEIETSDEEVESSTKSIPEGIEQFLDGGSTYAAFSNVTEIINTSKQSLDTYREKRKEGGDNEILQSTEKTLESSVTLGQSGSSSEQLATITRSRLPEDTSFLQKTWNAFLFILSSIYSLVLALISLALSFPLLVEILLLLFLLYFIYKFARRLGQRPQ